MKRNASNILVLLLLLAATKQVSPSMYYQEMEADGVRVAFISIDLRGSPLSLAPVMALGIPYSEESFESFIARCRPLAAINGTYFNLASRRPVGEISVDGFRFVSSRIGTIMGITADKKVLFFPAGSGSRPNGKALRMTLGAGPRLVSRGRVNRDFRGEGFRDPAIFGRARRSAIGVTASGRVVMLVSITPVTLSRLADMMRWLGCTDAMNLDGGTSTALFYRGLFVINPRRNLTNILCVFES